MSAWRRRQKSLLAPPPVAREGVATRVDCTGRIACRLLGVSQDRAGVAELGPENPALDDAVADAAGGLIARATDDGDAGGQAHCFCCEFMQRAGDFGGF